MSDGQMAFLWVVAYFAFVFITTHRVYTFVRDAAKAGCKAALAEYDAEYPDDEVPES